MVMVMMISMMAMVMMISMMVMVMMMALMTPFPKSVKLEGLGWFASHPGRGEACPGHVVAF